MTIILTMIIERPELTRRISSGKWVMVYGRRKTGKSFLVRNFERYDEYYFVKRDRTVITTDGWTEVGQDVLIDRLGRGLRDGKTYCIDEFHRLGDAFLDTLHSMEVSGRLILISSTQHLSRSLVSRSSPLLGKVKEVRVPPIDYTDLLASTGWTGKERYEMLAFMKEPLVIAQGYSDPVEVLLGTLLTVPALIGEIFTEEDRMLSSTYEAILRSCAVGRSTSGEVSSYLFARKMIMRDDPSLVQQYLRNLTDIGVLRRYDVWGKKRNVFKHASPLMGAFYALDERYGISDRELTRKEARPLLDEVIPRTMEDVLRDCIADRLGSVPYLDLSAEGEVDGILIRFNRPVALVEVKWKKRLDKKDVSEIERKFTYKEEEFKKVRKVLMVPDRDMVELEGIEVMEPMDILKMID